MNEGHLETFWQEKVGSSWKFLGIGWVATQFVHLDQLVLRQEKEELDKDMVETLQVQEKVDTLLNEVKTISTMVQEALSVLIIKYICKALI